MAGRPLRLLILSDGKAGHSNQSRAIAMALGRRREVEVVTLACKLRAGFLRRPLRWLLNSRHGKLPRWGFRLCHAADALPSRAPDLIVSAGGNTCHANAWVARELGCPNLFCGEIRGLRPGLFAGIISAYDVHAGNKPYLIAATPVPIDPAELAAQARAFRERTGLGAARCWSLLVGGEGAGYHYSRHDWQNLAAAMTALAGQHAIRWLVTTSRRTGSVAETILSTGLSPDSVAAAAYAGGGSGDIRYHEILGVAERHFCTEDSHMMISEAIASGKPVETLQPECFNTDASNLHFLEIYQRKGWIRRHPISTLASAGFPESTAENGNRPAALDELAAMLEDWWAGESIGRQAEPGVEPGEAQQPRRDAR